MGNKTSSNNMSGSSSSSAAAVAKQVEGKNSITHYNNKQKIWDDGQPVPEPEGSESIILGMGCFWCSENLWMKMTAAEGMHSTSVGYFGGDQPDPTYQSICSGRTGHAEVCRLVYDPNILPLKNILVTFWENHDPTRANQQGNDRGTQYRSCVFYSSDEQYVFHILFFKNDWHFVWQKWQQMVLNLDD